LRIPLALLVAEIVNGLLLVAVLRWATGSWDGALDVLATGIMFIFGWGTALFVGLRRSHTFMAIPTG
jgi:hypothetical protein